MSEFVQQRPCDQRRREGRGEARVEGQVRQHLADLRRDEKNDALKAAIDAAFDVLRFFQRVLDADAVIAHGRVDAGAGGDMLGVGVFDEGVLLGSINAADRISYASMLNGTVFNVSSGNVTDSVDQNEVIRLVTDIADVGGLTSALAADGSLAGLVAADGATSATLVTATSGDAHSVNLYRIEDSDADAVFDTVTLIGVVNMSSDDTIATLNRDNFA